MRGEIQHVARSTAARLEAEGLNRVDQMVGAFGPAMTVFSRYASVRTDTGEPVSVADAIQEAADGVAAWRVEQLAKRGLQGVDNESRFVLLCWDVLAAHEFRFNEAMLLGRSVGMDVAQLKAAGLVNAQGDKVKMLDQPLALTTYHVLVSKSHPNARTILYYVNASLEKLREKGEYDRIIERHLARFWEAQAAPSAAIGTTPAAGKAAPTKQPAEGPSALAGTPKTK